MEKISRFVIVSTSPSPTDKMVVEFEGVSIELDGHSIEAQFLSPRGFYILITTDKHIFEGFLHIYLIDSSAKVLDGLEAGAPYIDGQFELLGSSTPELIQFRFFSDRVYGLHILPAPSRFTRLPRGFRYKFGLFRKRFMRVVEKG